MRIPFTFFLTLLAALIVSWIGWRILKLGPKAMLGLAFVEVLALAIAWHHSFTLPLPPPAPAPTSTPAKSLSLSLFTLFVYYFLL